MRERHVSSLKNVILMCEKFYKLIFSRTHFHALNLKILQTGLDGLLSTAEVCVAICLPLRYVVN